jgi:ABC-2 type transport system permease protein
MNRLLGRKVDMGATFRHEFRRLLSQVWAWGGSFFLLAWGAVALHEAFMRQSSQLVDLISSYPKELMAFFGDMTRMTSPGGYLDSMLLSYGVVVLAMFSILAGSGLIAADEEAGRLDLVQAAPISRTTLFFGRFLGLAGATTAILALTWAGCALGLLSAQLGVTLWSLLLPFVSTFAVLMLFTGLALALSMLLPSRSAAATAASAVLVASYFLTSLARVINFLQAAARFSPLNYFQSGDAVNGLNWAWLSGLLGAAAFFTLLAWWGYQRRDLRVSGEGSWKTPSMERGKRAAPSPH